MLSLLGGIGLGLVWGALAARLIFRARWTVVLRVLLGLLVQGLVVLRLGALGATLAFAGATALSALLGALWLRRLAARYGAAS
jgi:hypothetical protein